MKKIKKILAKTKKILTAVAAAAVSGLSMAVAASAETQTGGGSALASASDQIIDQFQGAASDITPIILGVLGAGLVVFVIFVGIKLAKKMFTTVAK